MLLCPWNSPGKNIGVDCHFLLQGIFPTQGSNPGLPHCRQALYHLSHQESPTMGKMHSNSHFKNEYLGTSFPDGSDGKESTCNAGDLGLNPGLGRSPGEGHGNPFQYSCLENSHGQRSLVGYSPWGHKELDMTERLSMAQHEITWTK